MTNPTLIGSLVEPRLTAADTACWDRWRQTFSLRLRTREYGRRLDAACRLFDRELEKAKAPMVSWSGGKDSTAMTHLAVVRLGATHVTVMSEKDDLDYPGEEDYVTGLAKDWGIPLKIVRPAVSPKELIQLRANAMSAGEDIHSRSAELSKTCFYSLMQNANRPHDLVALGLRAEESGRRRALRATRGAAYELKDGTRRVLPIVDWDGLDVFAYLQSVGVEPFSVYRCCALLHKNEPWRIRKSWWLPGASAANGQWVWLRHYWPTLYSQAKYWFPDQSMYV